jgi:hypothetical protein
LVEGRWRWGEVGGCFGGGSQLTLGFSYDEALSEAAEVTLARMKVTQLYDADLGGTSQHGEAQNQEQAV